MGEPRRLRSKYSGPGHPWQAERIKQEKALIYEFGLTTKRELWKANSKLKAIANQAKRLIALRTEQSEVEAKQLLGRLSRLGMLTSEAQLNDVLALQVQDVLGRRLQTVLAKKGLARSPKQARQFIVHGHVKVGEKTVNAPSYLVPLGEEDKIVFVEKSSLSNPEHPERELKKSVVIEKPEEEAEEKPKKTKKAPAKKAEKKEAPKEKKEAPKAEKPAEVKKEAEAKPAEAPAEKKAAPAEAPKEEKKTEEAA